MMLDFERPWSLEPPQPIGPPFGIDAWCKLGGSAGQGVGTEAGTLGGHPGDTPQRGDAPQWVCWRCPISGRAGDTPQRGPSAGILEMPLSGYPAALCVQGSLSAALCGTLRAGVTFYSALPHFVCRGHVLERSAALCVQGGGHLLSGNPGDAPRRVSWRCPSAGILETLGGAPQWVSWRCPISGHAGDTPRRYPGDGHIALCGTLCAGVTFHSALPAGILEMPLITRRVRHPSRV